MNELKLTVDLIPRTAFNLSLYNYFKEHGQLDKWNKIKQELFKSEGRQCWICSDKNTRFEAHEYWEYDEASYIQKLISIHHLCSMCHKVKHISYWGTTDERLEQLSRIGLSRDDLVGHFCKVNNCSIEEFYKHLKESSSIHARRSKIQWKQDFGKYLPDE